jgi:hypothetical protein
VFSSDRLAAREGDAVGSATNFGDLAISNGKVLEATGPFDYDDCFWIAVLLVQTTPQGKGAVAAAHGPPDVKPDPSAPQQKMWTITNLDNSSDAGPFVQGRARASAVAVVLDRGDRIVIQWSRDVALV